MSNLNLFECPVMQSVLGDTLRPGGLDLTKRAVEFCKFKEEDILLDLGCGKGATIKYLKDNYNISAKGLDISPSLVEEARRINTSSEILISSGESIPYDNDCFNGVFAECTLSLMDNLEKVVDEVYRVLKLGGYLVISDIYAKEPKYIYELQGSSANSCLKNPHDLDKLKSLIKKKGFKILLEEKHDNYIKKLIFKIIFQYGSMEDFWKLSRGASLDRSKFQEVLVKAKLGYFLMVAGKEVKYV